MFSPLSFFNNNAAKVEKLFERHRVVTSALREKNPDSKAIEKLKTELDNINGLLDGYLKVVEIEPDNVPMLEQLVDRDAVHKHGVESVEALQKIRAGRWDDQKTVIALINPYTTTKKPQVLAAIYVYKQTSPVATFSDLAGSIPDIINPACSPVDMSKVAALIFYSISAMTDTKGMPLLKGSGERLINGLFPFLGERIMKGQLPETIVASTLSPDRSLRKFYDGTDLDQFDDLALKALAVQQLVKGRDPVRNFHCGNGVMIGDVKLHANTPDSPDGRLGAGVMVNYIYHLDPQLRAALQTLYKHGQFPNLLAQELMPHYNRDVPQLRAGLTAA